MKVPYIIRIKLDSWNNLAVGIWTVPAWIKLCNYWIVTVGLVVGVQLTAVNLTRISLYSMKP